VAPVRLEIGIDTRDPERLAPFWAAALGYEVGDLDEDGVYLDLVPPEPMLPVVYLQKVPEAKTVKNRVHLDLYVPNPDGLVARLSQLGARSISDWRSGSGGGRWKTMADPEGNEFCVCEAS
jgi:predicted enzyme related to lactoylglutathione lyase